ncbi:putative parallel beta-helix repeat protein [Rosellinia necatrix]|uniref:Putative parallel beta-helix repeat protein n=1 Tax=Rosellinia necatrix TaxID=77044 RepID=A0A1S8A652_ROSNE|nr:putative parallel beta-helix repeat protein [Rosellinia necatrix]
MTRFFSFATALLAVASGANAQCGSGSPHATVTGSGSSFTASKGSTSVYSGSDYRAAIQAAVDSISSGQRVAVMASGSIGANTITIGSGKIFEGCGTINTANRAGHGAIEVLNASGVQIPYLSMSKSIPPYPT